MYVCMCVPAPRLLITSGVMWAIYDQLNKLHSFCMSAIVSIDSRHSLTIEACRRNQPNKSKQILYNQLLPR